MPVPSTYALKKFSKFLSTVPAGNFAAEPPCYPNGCHVCEIEIDIATGVTELVRYIAVDEVGKVMNHLLAEGAQAIQTPRASEEERRHHDAIDADPDMPLLWVLRDRLDATGTKYGCGIAQCGACTVDIDGIATRSCSFPVSGAVGTKITTIEGLAQNGILHKVQKAWIEHDVPQCGYCQSGMLMRAAKLVQGTAKPTDAQIDSAIANLCACGTYPRVRAAIKRASGQAV